MSSRSSSAVNQLGGRDAGFAAERVTLRFDRGCSPCSTACEVMNRRGYWPPLIEHLPHESAALAQWCEMLRGRGPDATQKIVRRLGAHVRRRKGRCVIEFGLWGPEVDALGPEDLFLELLVPTDPIDFAAKEQHIRFHRTRVPVTRAGRFSWAAVAGAPTGHARQLGVLYWLRVREPDGNWRPLPDHLARSLPFGAFAPAEAYDVASMHARRSDLDWYAARATPGEAPRIEPPANLLELHVGTSSAGGTLGSLTRELQQTAQRVRTGRPLSAPDQLWLGYEAVELMPLHPTIAFEDGPPSFEPTHETEDTLTCTLRRPSTTNWGYDVLISGGAAVHAELLETRRPDELVALLEVLHGFPGGGMKVVIDVVYGHAHNQALELLAPEFLAGSNAYGQDLAYGHELMRALVLETHRRLLEFGFDGVRVDASQDCRIWDPQTQTSRHDDELLLAMSQTEVSVGGHRYRPWMVFEDGRPCPRDDWELACNYRTVIDLQTHDPNVFQWGPLTFAHNTPSLYTFWIENWWRLLEIAEHGQNWITGCANHDTLRRGAQLSTRLSVNTSLGNSYREILTHAYDNRAANLLFHALLPGVPMDFLHASARAPWGFMRNTDARYAVKLMAEESPLLTWQVDDAAYAEHFPRQRALGFAELDELRRFMQLLSASIEATDDDLDAVTAILRAHMHARAGAELPPLQALARAFMDDLHDYCNLSAHLDALDPAQVRFNLALRRFRQLRPWLRRNLVPPDHIARRWPVQGSVVVSGVRTGPAGERVAVIVNLEGAPAELVPGELLRVNEEGWALALSTTPRLEGTDISTHVTLTPNDGLLFTRAE